MKRICILPVAIMIIFGGYPVEDNTIDYKEVNLFGTEVKKEKSLEEIKKILEQQKREEILKDQQKEEQTKKETKKVETKINKTTKAKVKATIKKTTISYSRNELQSYAYSLVMSYGWSEADFNALVKLWDRESNWNPNAVNKSSGACGIPQAYPCSKLKDKTWQGQIKWGLNYIKGRYGSPSNAWQHSQQKGWY